MNEISSYSEIKQRHDGEWVLLGDIVTSKDLKILRGRVLWHSKDRNDMWRKAKELRPKRCAVLFMGRPPKGMEFALRASTACSAWISFGIAIW